MREVNAEKDQVYGKRPQNPAGCEASKRPRCQSRWRLRGAGGAMMGTHWPAQLSCRDNLITNNCVQRLHEFAVDVRSAGCEDDDHKMTLHDQRCCSHSACLCQKPFMEQYHGLPSTIVRLGHVLESGRAAAAFSEKVQQLANASFRYKAVSAYPPGYDEWGRKAQRVLEYSRSTRSLTVQQERLVLQADNGDWDEDLITHFCLTNGRCPLKCENAEHSKKLVVPLVVLSTTSQLVVALEYRWMGFDSASGWVFRGRRQHRLLDRALLRMFKKKDLAAAEAAMLQAAVNGVEAAPAAKKAVKAGKIIGFFSKVDPSCKKLEAAIVMGSPLQGFLNQSFSADEATHTFINMLMGVPEEDDAADLAAAEESAAHKNWMIISGARGREVVHKFSELMQSFDAPTWQETGGLGGSPAKFEGHRNCFRAGPMIT